MKRALTPPTLARRRAALRRVAAGWLLAGSLAVPAYAQFDKQAIHPGAPVPTLAATDLTGHAWNLADLKGRAVVVNFWGSWCPSCQEEMPTLQRLHDAAGDSGPVVLTVNVRETPERARRYLKANQLALPVIVDARGELAAAWGVRVFPATLLIDRAGRPRWRVLGPVDWSGTEAQGWIGALQR